MTAPTPLILKDGRIADVSVHTIPFASKTAELDSDTVSRLGRLLQPMATDCFLTAQAIGHVAPGASADGETLAAHRLARARADRIQSELIALGLPASAIASVWDWQFLVEEPRVTLWIFRLHEGEDCDGKPLSGQAVAAVDAPAEKPAAPAAAKPAPKQEPPASSKKEPPAPPKQVERADPKPLTLSKATPPASSEPAARAGSGSSGASANASSSKASSGSASRGTADAGTAAAGSGSGSPAPSATVTAGALPAPLRATEIKPLEPPRQPADQPAAEQKATSDMPAGPDRHASQPADLAAATVADGTTGGTSGTPAPEAEEAATPAAADAARPAAAEEGRKVAAAGAGAARADVVFAVNSSYFPPGAGDDLEQFVAALPPGDVSIVVTGAVGGADVQGASGDEAVKYNRWMAERRVGRVTEWLEKRLSGRNAEITTDYRMDDPSRAVSLTATPIS
ncbi:MAG: hypothetical protein KDE35_18310 [Geminicoccaceae bacterium]|nr:hypothetical protein [Geminicoccaceae bacterium]